MGFDLIGNNKNYFRNSIWYWPKLWYVICDTCDDILTEEDIENGQYNEGHFISEDKSKRISDRLEIVLEEYKKDLQELEDAVEDPLPFKVDNFKNFIAFCKKSGGFSIN